MVDCRRRSRAKVKHGGGRLWRRDSCAGVIFQTRWTRRTGRLIASSVEVRWLGLDADAGVSTRDQGCLSDGEGAIRHVSAQVVAKIAGARAAVKRADLISSLQTGAPSNREACGNGWHRSTA